MESSAVLKDCSTYAKEKQSLKKILDIYLNLSGAISLSFILVNLRG